jgi:uncharacterized membrane protein
VELLGNVFSSVCGSTNVWALGGELLPFCQRCTGLYVGSATALAVYSVARPRPTAGLLWLHGALLVQMAPFGYHWVPQGGIVRTVTGFAFACGLVYYLLQIPFEHHIVLRHGSFQRALAVLLGVLLLLLVSVQAGGPALAVVLAWFGFLGLVSLTLLTSTSFVLAGWMLVSRARTRRPEAA